jgi:phosphohistidine phosphatase
MRRLILLRHAKTERDSPSGHDRDRRLDERGRADAPVIGQYLAEQKLVPDLVLLSPSVRTRETWALVAAALPTAPAVDIVPALYGADPSEVLHAVQIASGRAGDGKMKTILVIGHNPGLHELSLGLIAKAKADDRNALEENLPTSGAAVLKFAVDDWSDLSPRSGTLERFVSPKLLRLQREDE